MNGRQWLHKRLADKSMNLCMLRKGVGSNVKHSQFVVNGIKNAKPLLLSHENIARNFFPLFEICMYDLSTLKHDILEAL